MQYTHTKTGDFITSILKSLDDENGVTWTREEVRLAICEALRIVDCLAFFNREIKTFQIPNNISFVDLTTVAELNSFVTFEKLISELKVELDRHLLEDAISTTTINKEVFDTTQYDNLIQRKVCEFLLETGMIVSRELLDMTSPPISTIQLSESTLNVRRLATLVDNNYSLITRESEENLKAFYSSSAIESRPYPEYFSQSASPKNLIRFYPKINANSKLELLSIKQPDLAGLTKLPIPTNLSWTIKYGILYEYFRQQGNGFDEQRAEYCKGRWQQGINLAKNYFCVLDIRIVDLLVDFSTLEDFDSFSPNWQNSLINKIENIPNLCIAFVAWNMIALSDKIDSSIIAYAELDFLRNTIVPLTDDDYIQIPFEFIQILDAYCQHYLQLKIGGERLSSGIEKLNSMFESLIKENARLNVVGNELAIIPYKTVKKQYMQKPVEAEGYELATSSNNANG